MSLDDVSRLLMFLAACDWIFTAMIYIAARQMKEPALTERATVSVILSLVATIAAVLGAARLGFVMLPPGWAVACLALGLVLVSVPQFVWVIGLALGRFK